MFGVSYTQACSTAGEGSRKCVVGYVLVSSPDDPTVEHADDAISQRCEALDMQLLHVEHEPGSPETLVRFGLWRALRALICLSCGTPPMPFVTSSEEEWLDLALSDCLCQSAAGASGIVVATESHICSNRDALSRFNAALNMRGKSVVYSQGSSNNNTSKSSSQQATAHR